MTTHTTGIPLESIPAPTLWPDANRRLLLGQGAPVDPLVRLASFDDTEFERFIWEWVRGYIAHRYAEVQHRGGAGDKGRDIVAWLDDSSAASRRWDLYQCKRYKDPLTPSDFLVELGKLCFYTHRKDYSTPRQYFIVSPKGVGNTLQDLIDDPPKLRVRLIEKWDDWCLEKITATGPVALVGDFRKHVEGFDLSIVKTLAPATLIEQHRETKDHLAVFGSSFKPRPLAQTPPADVAPKETMYVTSVYEAFADHLNSPVLSVQDFTQHTHLAQCFSHARECFYCAESLKEFSRDNLPDDREFGNLCNQVHQGVTPTLNKLHKDGYEKLVDVSERVVFLPITSNILVTEMEPNDRVGLCHQLANEGKIRWVKK
jgi:hypothetical protein